MFLLEEYENHMFKDKHQHVSWDKIPLILKLIQFEGVD